MSKYLTTVVETYRVDSEAEVQIMLEEAKRSLNYMLVKYTSEKKERKAKGEVVDEYYKLTLYKAFNNEKEPSDVITIYYEV